MNVLVIYATYSSGTQMVSELIENVLTAHGGQVTRKLVPQVRPGEVADFDAVVFGSPSWKVNDKEGQPHEFYQGFFQNARGLSLADKKVAVFGLGDSSYMTFCGAVDCLEQFVKEHDGTLLLPSLRIDGFYYDQQANTKLTEQWATALATHLAA